MNISNIHLVLRDKEWDSESIYVLETQVKA